jgi:hypothetical protein
MRAYGYRDLARTFPNDERRLFFARISTQHDATLLLLLFIAVLARIYRSLGESFQRARNLSGLYLAAASDLAKIFGGAARKRITPIAPFAPMTTLVKGFG